ncbi:hypothetical protein H6F42_16700 [Pseudanabaena sp. FACHB-1998]|nr:hypothetical protein [Pseudanabaena sp. FACHB-1998]
MATPFLHLVLRGLVRHHYYVFGEILDKSTSIDQRFKGLENIDISRNQDLMHIEPVSKLTGSMCIKSMAIFC